MHLAKPCTHIGYSTDTGSDAENSGEEQEKDPIKEEKAQLTVDLPPVDIVDAPHRYFVRLCDEHWLMMLLGLLVGRFFVTCCSFFQVKGCFLNVDLFSVVFDDHIPVWY